jgi:probable rRNA maturation factor
LNLKQTITFLLTHISNTACFTTLIEEKTSGVISYDKAVKFFNIQERYFMEDHPLIDLYVSVGNDVADRQIEQMLSAVNLDDIVLHTLEEAGIEQPVVLTLLITDDNGIRDMNKQYREQDKPTDVLSFPLLDKPLVEAPAEQLWTPQPSEEGEQLPDFVTPPGMITNLGDIIMSWPTVVLQATEAGHNPLVEVLYLLSHGVLHLIGYDDHTEAGYHAMVNIQLAVLQRLGYKAPEK